MAGRHVGPDQDVTTADLNVHFLAPVVVGPARAEATIVRAGRRLIVTAVDVTDAGRDRLAARSTLSFAVLKRRGQNRTAVPQNRTRRKPKRSQPTAAFNLAVRF